MNNEAQQASPGNDFKQTLGLFRAAVHHAAARRPPEAPNLVSLRDYTVRKQQRRVSWLVMTWTLGPVLAVLLVIGIYFRPRTAVQPAASYAADSALLEQVNEELSETAPGPLQPLYGPSSSRSSTATTHENSTPKVTQ